MDIKPARLFLIRHAETEWNTAQIFQGHLDSALTQRGLRQAAELARRLAGERVEALYSSDLGRAMGTARIVAERLGLEAVSRAELREIDCGEWTGKSYQEVRTLWPDHYANWKYHPDRHCMPAGESVAQVQARALRLLGEVHSSHAGRTLCAITHNTVVRAVLCHLRGWPLERFWEGERQPNCAINLIELADGKVALLDLADISHLTSVGTAGTTSVT